MDAIRPESDAADESRRWLRDLGALLALPALWVDREPAEIAADLLNVLFSILGLHAAYARFDDVGHGSPLVTWSPSGAAVPAELQRAIPTDGRGTGPAVLGGGSSGPLTVSSVPLTLPWGAGLVVVSAARRDFPTALESHLLVAAAGQAAIAVHSARRIAGAEDAWASAEAALARQNAVLRALVADVEPALRGAADRVQAASRLVSEVDASGLVAPAPIRHRQEAAPSVAPIRPLSRREAEVLGLLAQGLSNKEIAGVMWLSHRTIERHVTSVYRKIGVTRRSEATAFALRQGVV